MRSRKSTNICAGNIGAGKTRRFRRPRAIHPVSNPCQSAPLPETSRGNAVSSRPRNSSISLILCSDSPRKSLVSSSPILTLHTCCGAKGPHEDIHWQADPGGIQPHRADEGRDRLHCLPPFWPGDSHTPGSPSYQGWQQTFEPLVHPESLLDASSEYVHRRPMDFDRARLEGVRGSPREPVGPLAKNPTYAGVGRRIADIETRRKETRVKRLIEGVVFIAIATLLVGAVLWCIPK